jgi:hypothetical protein
MRLYPQSGSPTSWSAGQQGEVGYASTDGYLYAYNGSSWVKQGGVGSYALLQDQQPSGTDGGLLTVGNWGTRVLNTEVVDSDNIVTLASNQFTLAAGTYRIKAFACSWAAGDNKLALYNVTDASYTAYGMNARTSGYYGFGDKAVLSAQFTITATKVFELRHQASSPGPSGKAASFGVNEIYAEVEIWK